MDGWMLVHTHLYMHVCVYMAGWMVGCLYIRTYVCMCVYIWLDGWLDACTYALMYACVCVYGWMDGWMLVNTHLCMPVCTLSMYKECSATLSQKFKWGFCTSFGPNLTNQRFFSHRYKVTCYSLMRNWVKPFFQILVYIDVLNFHKLAVWR